MSEISSSTDEYSSVDTAVARIRSLMAEERISAARELVNEAIQLHPTCDELRQLEQVLHPGAVSASQLSNSSQASNMQWLSRNQEEHRGKWVALLDGELVAAEAELAVLMLSLLNLTIDRRPLIHHISD